MKFTNTFLLLLVACFMLNYSNSYSQCSTSLTAPTDNQTFNCDDAPLTLTWKGEVDLPFDIDYSNETYEDEASLTFITASGNITTPTLDIVGETCIGCSIAVPIWIGAVSSVQINDSCGDGMSCGNGDGSTYVNVYEPDGTPNGCANDDGSGGCANNGDGLSCDCNGATPTVTIPGSGGYTLNAGTATITGTGAAGVTSSTSIAFGDAEYDATTGDFTVTLDPSMFTAGSYALTFTLAGNQFGCDIMSSTINFTIDATNCPPPPVCASTYSYTAPTAVCSGAAIDFAIDAGCSVTTNTQDFSGAGGPAAGTVDHIQNVLFYYFDGTTTEAPAGFDPVTSINNVDVNLSISDFSANALGAVCSTDLSDGGWNNTTCAPFTATYFVLPFDFDIEDPTSPGNYGVYTDNDDANACDVLRFDVIIYPAQPTAAIDDTELCSGGSGTITVSVGTNSCFTEAYTAPANMTCAQITEANTGIISIADIETGLTVPAGSGCYTAIDVPVAVNPAQPTVTETMGSCNTGAQVQLTAADASLCGTPTMGTAPTDMPCGNGTNSEPLNYTFAAADIATAFGATDATCYTPLSGTVTADCAQSFCPLPAGIALGISDPCTCNGDQPADDATMNGIGSFGEVVSVTGTGGVGVYYVSAITANGSAATGTLPTGVAVGDVLTPGATQHDIPFTHYDGDGYTMEITWAGTDNMVGTADDMVVGSIGNRCAYASVVADAVAGQFNCADAEDVALTATIVDGGGTGTEVWSDDTGDALGVTGSNFNGAGLMGTVNVTLTYTGAVTGNVSPDQGTTVMYPGCEATSSTGVSIMECPCDADNGTLENVPPGN